MPNPTYPRRSIFNTPRQRVLVLSSLVLGSGLFLGLKWRAVLQRSEAAKRASAKGDYAVDAGERSGGGV